MRVILFLHLLLAIPSGFGDELRILENDFDAEKAHIEMIDRAGRTPGKKDKLRSAYFIFENDLIGGQRLAAYRRAARRGVDVELLLDGYLFHLKPTIVAHLLSEGVKIRIFNCPGFTWGSQFSRRLTKCAGGLRPYDAMTKRLHVKYEVLGDSEMITEGRNVSDNYFAPRHRDPLYNFTDRSVWTQGEAAAANARYHDDLWNSPYVKDLPFGKELKPLIAMGQSQIDEFDRILESTSKHLASRPFEFPPLSIDPAKISFIADPIRNKRQWTGVTAEILNRVASARQSIYGETPYLSPTPVLRDAFEGAIQRGATVQILTNSRIALDEPMVKLAYNDNLNALLREKVQINIFREIGTLHAKALVIDGRYTMLMTSNLNGRSLQTDLEMGLVIDDVETSKRITESIARRKDFHLSGRPLHSSTRNALRARGVVDKCVALFKTAAAHLFSSQF